MKFYIFHFPLFLFRDRMYCEEFVYLLASYSRSNHPELFLRKGVLKIYSKFTEEHPCRSAISIKLLHIFRTLSLNSFMTDFLIIKKPFH